MKKSELAVDVRNVTKTFKMNVGYITNIALMHKKRWPSGFPSTKTALNDVSIEIPQGDIVGIIGRNGAGKSTLLRIISGIIKPTSGIVRTNGNISTLLELAAGFNVFFTGRENVVFLCELMGIAKSEIKDVIERVKEFSELEESFDYPVRMYSRGMKARLGFSLSINIDPEILIIDEVLAVGDRRFKKKCVSVMDSFFSRGNTILIATHDLSFVREICHRALHMKDGRIVADGDPKSVVTGYKRKN